MIIFEYNIVNNKWQTFAVCIVTPDGLQSLLLASQKELCSMEKVSNSNSEERRFTNLFLSQREGIWAA
jgi:hypothetical protein